jgi:phospholipase C
MVSDDRRKFLRFAAATAGAAGVNVMPIGVRQALAIPAARETGTIQDVKHIVILMQENRSFDHYFGTMKGVRGFGDPRAATLPGGKPVWYQPNNGSYVLPFRPDLPQLGLQFLEGTPHDWTSTHKAWNEGRYDQWVPNKGANTMAYFTREDIPYHFALADAFTVCDAYHCSLMGPTDPNRYHMWTGWVGNDGAGGGPVIDNAEVGYEWSTLPERLQQAGLSWKIYQDAGTGLDANGFWGWTDNPYIGNYGDNSLLYFHQYQNAAPGTPLYDRARTGTRVAQNPGQTFFDVLKNDVRNNTLPQVSWIVAPEAFSEHPNWPANYGAWYVSQVLETLTSNPEVWSKTALFVTFDENDGFFDHVIPPFPPASRDAGLSTVDVSGELFAGNASYPAGPYGLGQRVPMTIVSPWTKGGWVCSQVFDHTSLIRFIEARFGTSHPGIVEPNITPWRRAICGDLTSAFNFDDPDADLMPLPSTLGYVPIDALRHPSTLPSPPSDQALPSQERGVRRSRAIPYELHAEARIDNETRRLWVDFVNRGSAGAAFLVATPGAPSAPRTYTVEAGKSLSDFWTTAVPASGLYDLLVTGPQGFLRRFSGDALAAASKKSIAAEVRSTCEPHEGGRLRLTLTNQGSTAIRLTVAANAYTHQAPHTYLVGPGMSVEDNWPLKESLGWYDLSVTTDASPAFLRRLAGRVETGRPSVSDPAIAAPTR